MSTNVRSAKSRGFTLVELLVVIAIIGILVAMLLPAVQSAREAARRMSCGNQIKQLMLGLHNYHATYSTFPPEAIWKVDLRASSGFGAQARNFTWITMVLPFIEQTPLHDQINFSQPLWAQTLVSGASGTPTPIRSVDLPILLCPSDEVTGPSNNHGFAITSYAGSEGWDWWGRGGEFYAGVFTLARANRFRDIKDGTSNTVAIGEVTTVGRCCRPAGTPRTAGGSGRLRRGNERVFRSSLIATGVHPTIASTSRTYVTAPLPRADNSGSNAGWWGPWARPHAYHPVYSTHNAMNVEWPGAASTHPGGAQFGLADGSVRFLTNSISNGGNGGPTNDPEGEFGNVWVSIHTIQGHPNEDKTGIPN